MQFASETSPELVRLSRPEERRMLVTAEKRLAAGDPKGRAGTGATGAG